MPRKKLPPCPQCSHVDKESGERCKKKAVRGSKRCRSHTRPGRKPTTGKDVRVIASKSIRDAIDRKLADDNLLNMRKQFAFWDYLFDEKVDKVMTSGEHAELWKSAQKFFSLAMGAQKASDAEQFKFAMQQLGQVLQNGVGAQVAEEQAATITDLMQRVMTSETRRSVALDDQIKPEWFLWFLGVLEDGIRVCISKPEDAEAFEAHVRRAISRKPGGDIRLSR